MCYLCKFIFVCFVLILIYNLLLTFLYQRTEVLLKRKERTVDVLRKRCLDLEEKLNGYNRFEIVRTADDFNNRNKEDKQDVQM